MHLPGPVRAAIGLVATAATEAKHLPDRAIELPMLAVSSALQASLRAQQRYARLAARGDEVLNRRTPTEAPPPWATFDEPVAGSEGTAGDDLRSTVFGHSDIGHSDEDEDELPARSVLDELFGVDDPRQPASGKTASAPAKKKSVKNAGGKPTTKATVKTAKKAAKNSVNTPRHTPLSAFDRVADDAPDSAVDDSAAD